MGKGTVRGIYDILSQVRWGARAADIVSNVFWFLPVGRRAPSDWVQALA